MAISRDKKKQIINSLQDIVKRARAIVFVNFRGLSVIQANELRNKLRQIKVDYTVIKKTLLKKVLRETEIKGKIPELIGEVAVASGDDLITPSKGIYDFHKQTGLLEIIGGVFDKEYINKEAMLTIAQIPPREVLYAQLVHAINWPIQSLAIALNQIASGRKTDD